MRASTDGKRAARDGAVHAEHVGGEAAHRGERRLASGPEARALFLVRGFFDPVRARVARNVAHTHNGIGDFRLQTVEFDDQQAFRVARIARRAIVFDGGDAAAIHELHGGGHDAGCNHVCHAHAGIGHGAERGDQRARHRRLGKNAQRRFDHDTQ